jgi:hypothetical protein
MWEKVPTPRRIARRRRGKDRPDIDESADVELNPAERLRSEQAEHTRLVQVAQSPRWELPDSSVGSARFSRTL